MEKERGVSQRQPHPLYPFLAVAAIACTTGFAVTFAALECGGRWLKNRIDANGGIR